MSNVCAIIVGIGRYAHSGGWTINSASANALLFAELLLKSGILEHRNLYLFLDTEHEEQNRRADQLAENKANVVRSATSDKIDTFWRNDLLRLAQNGELSNLIFYWSGHGFIDKDDRVLACCDFLSPQLNNKVFNLTAFLSHLRSPQYQGFTRQIGFVDTCAVHAKIKFDPIRTVPDCHSESTEQVVYFAAPEGKYAYEESEDGEIGAFTRLAGGVLQSFNAWPQTDELWEAMEVAFKDCKRDLYRVTCMDPRKELSHRIVGVHRSDDWVVESICNLLHPLAVSDSVYHLHYLSTVRILGTPELFRAQGLTGMISALVGLGDGAKGALTYGLLQFLIRLTSEDSIKAPVEGWLAKHATSQGNAIANVRTKIADEAESSIFIVDVRNDANGEIESFELFLRSSNLDPVCGFQAISRQVKNWDNFCETLLAEIEHAKNCHNVQDFELQFLVDPPLFHHQFHSIGPDWHEHLVLVRYRTRVLSRNRIVRQIWMEYADEIRVLQPKDLPVLKVSSDTTDDEYRKKGLRYLASLVCSTCSQSEKSRILQLLRIGSPYIYWLHKLSPTMKLDEIQAKFEQWLQAISDKTISDFPHEFTRERILGNEFASNATLLWDDPRFNPFHKHGAPPNV